LLSQSSSSFVRKTGIVTPLINLWLNYLSGYLPGAVAPVADPIRWSRDTTSRVSEHQLSMKNPILVDLIFCSPFLETFIDEAWIMWSGKLFHMWITLLEKKYSRMSFVQLCLEIFKEWH